jgi:hypothetical protein
LRRNFGLNSGQNDFAAHFLMRFGFHCSFFKQNFADFYQNSGWRVVAKSSQLFIPAFSMSQSRL